MGKPKTGKKDKASTQNDSGNAKDTWDEDDDGEVEFAAPVRQTRGFASLMVEDDGVEEEAPDEEEEKEPEVVDKKAKPASAADKKKGKQEKKGKGKRTKEDDEIEMLAAAIENADLSKGEKKKKEQTPTLAEGSSGAENATHDDGNLEDLLREIEDEYQEKEKTKKKKKKKKGKQAEEEDEEEPEDAESKEGEEAENDDAEGTVHVKTKAEKKAEKKEKERQQKAAQKEAPKKDVKKEAVQPKPAPASTPAPAPAVAAAPAQASAPAAEPQEKESTPEAEKPDEAGHEDEQGSDDETDKKKKKKKKKVEVKEAPKAKRPGSKAVKAIQEHLVKIKQEEERLRQEEEEKFQREEEAARLAEEQKQKELERKRRKREKEKERIQKKKQEGTYLTEKEREKARVDQMKLQALIEAGYQVGPSKENEAAAAPARPSARFQRIRKNKKKPEEEAAVGAGGDEKPEEAVQEQQQANQQEVVAEPEESLKDNWDDDDVKDEWDADEEEATKPSPKTKTTAATRAAAKQQQQQSKQQLKTQESGAADSESEESGAESDTGSESDDEEESSEAESSSSESEDAGEDEETVIERARKRIEARHEAAEKNRDINNLRAPVVCVLGHVDTGKTKLLDNLRRTHVQDGEAGGITQQIGATNVPVETIRERTRMCKDLKELRLPGLLLIDTPGHESFSNLRARGSSLCDIAILVIDIMHGIEKQTEEGLELLKQRKTPFVVALNKIDRLYGWQTNPASDIQLLFKKQNPNTVLDFKDRLDVVKLQLSERGLNSTLYYENKDLEEYISIVPVSAVSGDGMGNLISCICDFSQTRLAQRLAFSEDLQCTVMEVKAIGGLGTTIDVCLVNGCLKEGQKIIVAGQEGPIVTQIRGLLLPAPNRELRVKNQYRKEKVVVAAQGIKIAAKDLEKALAGLPLYVANRSDEVLYYKQELTTQLKKVLGSIRVQERGVFVQASTLGSLEALLAFLKSSKIPFAGIDIGPVHRKGVMKASIMLEHEPRYAAILAFDVRVERDAQEYADSLGVRIFTADIIYHLFDKFTKYQDEWKQRKREEHRSLAVFPCKLRILPQFVFNARNPIVVGVIIEDGFIREGTPICVQNKEEPGQFIDLGQITSIESNHKPLTEAKKGIEVCIKIEAVPGEAPKLYGRHFDEKDPLLSKVTRQSIDVVKEYFKDDMQKSDWQLLIELKRLFKIL